MPRFRVFATADIGDAAFARLRERGYEVEVYPNPEPPPKSLIIEKVRSGIDGLITTLRDKIDAEVFEAGEGTLKVRGAVRGRLRQHRSRRCQPLQDSVHQYADVLTEATAEFAFFALADLSRRLWTAENLVRENQWGFWHPYLPFLGDEMTGKTIAHHRHRAHRPGDGQEVQRLRHEHPVLPAEPAGRKVVDALQAEWTCAISAECSGSARRFDTSSLEDALRQSDFVSIHVPLLREGEGKNPTYHLFNETTLRMDEADGLPGQHVAWCGDRRSGAGPRRSRRNGLRELHSMCMKLSRCRRLTAARSGDRRPLPALSALCQRRTYHAAVVDPNRGMAGRCVQGLIDVLEGNYGGDIQKMPYVVNKEAFR